MSEKRKPNKDQLTEWFESPVTEYFFSLLSDIKDRTAFQLADQGYDTDSPERLMAQRGNLWGIHNTLADLESVFESKSLDELEEEDDAEHVGDTPFGGSGPH